MLTSDGPQRLVQENTYSSPPLPPDVGFFQEKNNYLCTYDLYGPVRKVYDGADTGRLRGEVWGGGVLALEIESFVGPCEIARVDRRVLFGKFLFFTLSFVAVFRSGIRDPESGKGKNQDPGKTSRIRNTARNTAIPMTGRVAHRSKLDTFYVSDTQ